ncbi:UDP-N-acetylglucosamine 2-epimerase (non-hydrolyzing) [Candidatus Woesearchaeota archaeon]|nr:UDP-N-acetylglucosamine 2-epimerase (non-hydrolyzing) [Candidatus Woesearchaeota archaeon]
MKKIVTIAGTRPEWTKLSALIPLLDKEFDHILVHTGQHYSYNMDKIFFEELKLREPNYCLEVGSGTQAEQVGKGMIEFEKILVNEKPDLVIVFADTNAPLTGALVASKLHIPVCHIEAGCRSFNRRMPEEINRIVADHCSEMFFPPDKAAYKNLRKEGIPKEKIFLKGRTIYDACLRIKKLALKTNILEKLNLEKEKYAAVTIHRAENTNNIEVLKGLVNSLNEISELIKIVFPIHPRTKKVLEENNIKLNDKILITEPLGYLEFTNLLINSKFTMSDSGSIQEEGVIYNVPCLILRNETEWTEFVDAGKNILLTTNPEKIISITKDLLNNEEKLKQMREIKIKHKKNVCKKIVWILKNEFEKGL